MRRSLIAAAGAALAIAACGEEDLGAAPDVRGLTLPKAEERLKTAGYSADVKSDAVFGVIVRENFRVCEQHKPEDGNLVPLDVSKQCGE